MSAETDLVRAIGTKFIQRRDVKAVQGETNSKGEMMAWQPVRSPFTLQDFHDHLSGNRTFGHYLVDVDGKCKLFAFDIDLNKEGELTDSTGSTVPCDPRAVILDKQHWGRPQLIAELLAMAEGLASRIVNLLGISVAIYWSGNKGIHVYGFTGETEALYAREAAHGVLNSFNCFEAYRGDNFFRHTQFYSNISIETFPKQEKLSNPDGLGNLMALPLGINRKSGENTMFLQTKGQKLDELVELDPMRALSGDLPWE